MEPIETFLSEFPVNIEINVQWGDMDAAQHVNNTVYLRWVENSRIEIFKKVGVSEQPESGDTWIILGYQDCKYIFPVTYPDTVIVGVKVKDIEKDRIFLQSHIFSKKHQRLVAISNQTVVTYDYSALKKADVPEALKEQLLAMKG